MCNYNYKCYLWHSSDHFMTLKAVRMWWATWVDWSLLWEVDHFWHLCHWQNSESFTVIGTPFFPFLEGGFIYVFLFIWNAVKQRTKTDSPFIHRLTPWIPTSARMWNQEPRIPHRSPIWVTGIQVPELPPAPSRMKLSRELDGKQKSPDLNKALQGPALWHSDWHHPL